MATTDDTDDTGGNGAALPVIECVLFSPTDGVDRAEFVAAAAGVSTWARAQPGFVSRELFEVGDGRWIDVVRWATLPDAHVAAESAMTSELCGPFFSMIEMSSMTMLHGTPAIPAVRP
jgi:hypothetical protein